MARRKRSCSSSGTHKRQEHKIKETMEKKHSGPIASPKEFVSMSVNISSHILIVIHCPTIRQAGLIISDLDQYYFWPDV
jgi:hypothetical protein